MVGIEVGLVGARVGAVVEAGAENKCGNKENDE